EEKEKKEHKGRDRRIPSIGRPHVALKFLIPKSTVGTLIGRAGRAITDIQSRTRTKIQLSQNNVTGYYPGTSDRIALLRGEKENVIQAVRAIVEKILPGLTYQPGSSHVIWLILVLPATLTGRLIGTKGQTIKNIMAHSGARIDLEKSEATLVAAERICTVMGPKDCILLAVAAVLGGSMTISLRLLLLIIAFFIKLH
ncbi:unnamed protein product, partial [Chrysoparadoxa australica]